MSGLQGRSHRRLQQSLRVKAQLEELRMLAQLEAEQRKRTRQLMSDGSRKPTPEKPQAPQQQQQQQHTQLPGKQGKQAVGSSTPEQRPLPDRHVKQPARQQQHSQPPGKQGKQTAGSSTLEQNLPDRQAKQPKGSKQQLLDRQPKATSPEAEAQAAGISGSPASPSTGPSRASTDSSAADRMPEGPVVQAPPWPPAAHALNSPDR